jgi:maltose O-acetyltransferase
MARFSTLRRLITRTRRAIQQARVRSAPVSRYHLPPGMKVGKDCHIYTGNLDGRFGRYITLGDEVVLAGRAKIICHDAARGGQTGVYLTAPVKIGSRTYIGADATVLPGVTIGEDVVVGAGSVVTKDVLDGVVVAGSPARQVGTSADLDKRRLALPDSLPVFDPGSTTFSRCRRTALTNSTGPFRNMEAMSSSTVLSTSVVAPAVAH